MQIGSIRNLLFLFLATVGFCEADSNKMVALFGSIDKSINAQRYRDGISIATQLQKQILSTDEQCTLYIKFGQCYYGLWDVAASEEYLHKGLSIATSTRDPKKYFEDISFRLGELYFATKNYSKAKPHFQYLAGLVDSKSFPHYLYFLGSTQLLLGEKENALKSFERLTNTFPEHFDSRLVSKKIQSLK